MTKSIEQLQNEVTAFRTLIHQLVQRVEALETQSKPQSNKQPARKKRRTGTNTYMFWCNNMKNRERVRAQFQEAAGPGAQVDMKAVVSELGRQWQALPDCAKEDVKRLCADHNRAQAKGDSENE